MGRSSASGQFSEKMLLAEEFWGGGGFFSGWIILLED